jgi:NAD(P)-dependent dehydrogenase (short-subunit alcohol dehydrogenase family)
MAKLERKIALVTGASSGIGEATAERLARGGYKVYGTSRRRAHAGQRSFEMPTLDVTSDASVEAVARTSCNPTPRSMSIATFARPSARG